MFETPDPKPEPDEEPQDPAAEDDPYSSDEEAEVAARLESLGYM
jgi:hypothetical protein